LIAFDSRFNSTWRIFRSSPRIIPTRSPTVIWSVTPRRLARSRTSVRALSSVAGRSKSVSSSSIRPASTFDRSRMSLISDSRCVPEAWMSRRYSACLSFSSPNMRSFSTSENPMIAFSGVRSSCDMFARNSDLCRLATSSCRLLSAISRKSRAFWIASADWVAKVFSTSITSGGYSPGAFRVRDRLPMIWSSRRSCGSGS
jgi:hypothetical protein